MESSLSHDDGLRGVHQQGLRHAAFILRHCARHWHGRGHYNGTPTGLAMAYRMS